MRVPNGGLTNYAWITMILLSVGGNLSAGEPDACQALDIGSRLELFVSRHLIDRMEDVEEIIGDEIERVVQWKGNPELEAFAGKPVRLRLVMIECDLYSFQFKP